MLFLKKWRQNSHPKFQMTTAQFSYIIPWRSSVGASVVLDEVPLLCAGNTDALRHITGTSCVRVPLPFRFFTGTPVHDPYPEDQKEQSHKGAFKTQICDPGVFFGFRVDESKCTHCQACVRACRMDVKKVGDTECIQCGECRKNAPREP